MSESVAKAAVSRATRVENSRGSVTGLMWTGQDVVGVGTVRYSGDGGSDGEGAGRTIQTVEKV